MPQKELSGATLMYPAADAETAEVVEVLYERGTRLLKDHWGLTPPPDLSVDVATTWLHWTSFDRAARPVVLYLLPWFWYELSFSGLWDKAYVNGGRLSASHGAMRVKSLRHLPAENPPSLQASWTSEPESEWDQRKVWKLMVGHTLARVFLPQRTPAWLIDGIGGHVGSALIDEPWRLPKDWGPIVRWAGHAPRRLSSHVLADLSQEEIDEFVAQSSWPRWVTRYLRDQHADVLHEILAFEPELLEVEARTERLLHERLGLPKDSLWRDLTQRVVYHYGGPEAKTELMTPVAEAIPSTADDDDNPYRAPAYGITPSSGYRRSPLLPQVVPWLLVVLAMALLAVGIFIVRPIVHNIAVLSWMAGATTGMIVGWIVYQMLFSRPSRASRAPPWLSSTLMIVYAVAGIVFMRWEWAAMLASYAFSGLASLLVGFWLVQVFYVAWRVTVDLVRGK